MGFTSQFMSELKRPSVHTSGTATLVRVIKVDVNPCYLESRRSSEDGGAPMLLLDFGPHRPGKPLGVVFSVGNHFWRMQVGTVVPLLRVRL